MKKVLSALVILIVLFSALTLVGTSGCGRSSEPEPTPEPTPRPTPEPSKPENEEPEPVTLVNYTGIVEHIFLYEVLAWPEVAWNSDRQSAFDSNYLSADEFKKILNRLYENNYVLINLNDVYSEYMSETGYYKMLKNTLEIPEGKKPLVITFENLIFNEDNIPYGFMSKYIIGTDGEIWAEGVDPEGDTVISQDLSAVTLLEKFIRANPGFSHNGAKGCISLTGARGILGYRTQKKDDETESERLNRMREVALVKPVVSKLKENGWYFASHTYGRIFLGQNNTTLEIVQEDAERWRDEVGAIVGETKILSYPDSSRLDGGDQNAPGPAMQYYVSIGFRYFGAQGAKHHIKNKSDDFNITAIVYDRAFLGGLALRYHRNFLSRFFEVQDIYDSRRPDIGNTWDDAG